MTNDELRKIINQYQRGKIDNIEFIKNLFSNLTSRDLSYLRLEEDKVESEELTLEEAQEKLISTKVFVSDKSEEIQKKLFSLGFKWETHGDMICYLHAPFIYIKKGLILYYGDYFIDYRRDEGREITLEEILSLNIKKEKPKHIFKPLERVLIRDHDNCVWETSLFFDYTKDNTHPYLCLEASWSQCIPYEGNEKLLGTRNSKV